MSAGPPPALLLLRKYLRWGITAGVAGFVWYWGVGRWKGKERQDAKVLHDAEVSKSVKDHLVDIRRNNRLRQKEALLLLQQEQQEKEKQRQRERTQKDQQDQQQEWARRRQER